MTTILKLDVVGINEENEVLTIGFADAPLEVSEYLLFSISLDEEEAQADEVYVERNDQLCGTYGGIEKLALFRDHLALRLNKKTSAALQTERDVNVFFHASDEQFAQLQTDFARLFVSNPALYIAP